MPQMAPISWLILFIIFSLSFIIFNMMNYYCFNKKTNTKNIINDNNFNNSTLNWKW